MSNEKKKQSKNDGKYEKKQRFVVWLHPTTNESIENMYKIYDCRSKSEFVDKAINFYIGHLLAKDNSGYFPNIFLSTMRAIIDEKSNRQCGLLFKMAVEIAIMQNLIAATNDIDPISLERLRGQCVLEVKRINGMLSFEDAVDWQK